MVIGELKNNMILKDHKNLTNWQSIAEKASYNNDMSTLGTKSPCTY